MACTAATSTEVQVDSSTADVSTVTFSLSSSNINVANSSGQTSSLSRGWTVLFGEPASLRASATAIGGQCCTSDAIGGRVRRGMLSVMAADWEAEVS